MGVAMNPLIPDPDPIETVERPKVWGAWSGPRLTDYTVAPHWITPAPTTPSHHPNYRPPEERAKSAAWARAARISLGLTQGELGVAVGLSVTTWSKYEHGTTTPCERVKWAVQALLDGTRALPLEAT